MMMKSSTMLTRRLTSSSCASAILRAFSSTRPPPPPRTNRFQQGGSSNNRNSSNSNNETNQHVPLRTKAVSMFHADYDDDGTEDPFETDQNMFQDGEAETKDAYVEHKSRLADVLIQEERERAEQKLRWLENAKPPERVSQIDERGRAYGRGGRKTSTARVWIQPGTGEVVINRLRMEDYVRLPHRRELILEPFVCTKTCGKFDVMAWVEGGGTTGQSGAIRHGIARALNHYNPDLYRAPLKLFGLLTRDPRQVERKKIGLRKARKAPQWVKR